MRSEIAKPCAVSAEFERGALTKPRQDVDPLAGGGRVSDFDYDKLREEGRERARSTAVWDPRYCSKEY